MHITSKQLDYLFKYVFIIYIFIMYYVLVVQT